MQQRHLLGAELKVIAGFEAKVAVGHEEERRDRRLSELFSGVGEWQQCEAEEQYGEDDEAERREEPAGASFVEV